MQDEKAPPILELTAITGRDWLAGWSPVGCCFRLATHLETTHARMHFVSGWAFRIQVQE